MTNGDRYIVEDGEWHRIYRTAAHPRVYESKLASGETHISLSDLQARWVRWHDGQKTQFARAFGHKTELKDEDQKILEFLMAQDCEGVGASVARLSARHPDALRSSDFLLRGIEMFPHDRANFLQGLLYLSAPQTEKTLQQLFEQLNERAQHDSQDSELIIALLYTAATLFKLNGKESFRTTVRSFLKHPDSSVRANAVQCIGELGG